MYNLVINTKKMWTILSICYIIFYIGIQYIVLVVNPNMLSKPLEGKQVFLFEIIFNLALCQIMALSYSISYLNKTYQLREKIPIKIIFNGDKKNE